MPGSIGTPLRATPNPAGRSQVDGAVEITDLHRTAANKALVLELPELPDARHVTFEFVWGMSHPRTRKARRNQMRDFEGVSLEVVRVDLGEAKEIYDTFTLHKDSRLWVRETESGAMGRLPLMDVLGEMQGAWKFLNFRDDL